MKNARWMSGALVMLVLASGCRKKENGEPIAGLPGGCAGTVALQYGAVDAGVCLDGRATCEKMYQTVDLNASLMNAWLCKNADCAAGIPAKTCGETYPDLTAPCYVEIPNTHILTNAGDVLFMNAMKDGFQTYALKTLSCS